MPTVERLASYTSRQLDEAHATDFARYVKCLHAGRGPDTAATLFAEHYPRSLSASLVQQHVALQGKAAVAAGSTTDATWAGPLAVPRPLTDGFLAIARPLEVLAQLEGVRRVPVNTAVPVWTPTAQSAAVWTGQGELKAISAFAFNAATLTPSKLAVICIVTKELLTFGQDSDVALRDVLVYQIVTGVNQEFLDPTKAPVANVRPGSVTNQGTLVATANNAVTDATAVLSALLSARPAVTNPALIMNAQAAAAVIGTGNEPLLTLRGGTALGAAVIVTPAAGKTVAALDPSGLLLHDDGIALDASRHASIVMDSAPVSGAAAIVTSLFQQNLIGLRAERFISWKLTDATACQYRDEDMSVLHLSMFGPALERWREAPHTLTTLDLDVLREFGSKELVTQATAARTKALQPPTAAAPVRTKSVEPPASASRVISNSGTVPAETVDQFLARLGVAPVSTAGVSYDGQAYQEAVHRYYGAPATVTLVDVQQLAIVDPALGTLARAKQLGYVEPAAPEDATLAQMHVTGRLLLHVITDYVTPILASVRYTSQETHTRIDTLQQRCTMLEVTTAQQRQAIDRLTRELEAAAAVTR